jgi:hypothetical protein
MCGDVYRMRVITLPNERNALKGRFLAMQLAINEI